MQFDLFDQDRNRILETKSYSEFKDALLAYDCQLCPLGRSRSRIVVDRGNPRSRIMIISERPGENEDREGKAFVGRAGELLDRMMEAIKLDTNREMLIVNAVKCLPPEDRSPTDSEVKTCLPYLQKQIELMAPKIIILLGAVALKHILPEVKEFKMEEEAGKLFTLASYPGIQFMVLFHPAYLLRDPRKKAPTWEHLKVLRDYLNRLTG